MTDPLELPEDTEWLIGKVTPRVIGFFHNGEPSAAVMLHVEADGQPDTLIPLDRKGLPNLIQKLAALLSEFDDLTDVATAFLADLLTGEDYPTADTSSEGA